MIPRSGPAPRHLAIRAPNWVGDLAMATPMLAAAAADPRFERVDILVRAHLAPLLSGTPLVPLLRPLGDSREEVALYTRLRPDAALLLTTSLGSAWRAFLGRVPRRIGAALSGRRLLLTQSLTPPTRGGRRLPYPTAHLMRDVAGLLGIAVPDLTPRLAVPPGATEALRALLAGAGLAADEPYLACAPGAAFGASKLWPPAHFAAAIDALHAKTGLRTVISGGPAETATIEAVATLCASPAVSLAPFPRDLVQLLALVHGARLLLVGDSGPRWVAAAFGVPCVSVMGPNFPELTASSLERCRVLRVEDLECSPCLERVCPLGHHRCMRDLGPERVVAAALELLEEVRAGGAAV
jgi:heptosyltransferase II